MSPLRWSLFLPAINPHPQRALPFLVFTILCYTHFCLLPLDLGRFLEGHRLLSFSISSNASSSVVLRPCTLAPAVLIHAGSWAPPAPTESEPLGMASRCSLCIPRSEKHELTTCSSPSSWRGGRKREERRQKEGMARWESGRRVDLVATVAMQNQGPFASLLSPSSNEQ